MKHTKWRCVEPYTQIITWYYMCRSCGYLHNRCHDMITLYALYVDNVHYSDYIPARCIKCKALESMLFTNNSAGPVVVVVDEI